MLKGKKLIVGVTGSIAAYKSALLVREFIKSGAEVKVIMTKDATDFITATTLSTLSKNPVIHSFLSDKKSGLWSNHVELGEWADLMIIAPATANSIAKMAHGLCDNILLATYLSAKCPVIIAPAMDLDMYKHQSTSANIKTLSSQGIQIIEPDSGELASGLIGKGRMAEPESIKNYVENIFSQKKKLKGKKCLVTAGPTLERIDPVRFISNHSTGTMGYALANTLADYGAQVTLVSGPTRLSVSHPNIKLVDVESAADMKRECDKVFDETDITIMSSAVADYTPREVADHKIKKKDNDLKIDLVRTEDILQGLGKRKREDQILVGFALETDNEIDNARKKLIKKNLSFIVLNSLKENGAGFGTSTNKIKIIDRSNKIREYELKSKMDVAKDIVELITNID